MDLTQEISFLDHPKNTNNLNNIYLKTDLGVLDILSETQPAGSLEEIKARAIEIPLYGFNCKVISIEDLIKYRLDTESFIDELADKSGLSFLNSESKRYSERSSVVYAIKLTLVYMRLIALKRDQA